jgi:mono/diheme cytochrome c family protein
MLTAKGIILLLAGLSASAALALFILLPRMNWTAAQQPGAIETWLANSVRERWAKIHASDQKNPLAATPENLAAGRREYDEHCALCHGLDGSGRNQLHVDFYPPVARLTGDTQRMSDAEIFFVVSNGVALSAMPAFGTDYSSEEIWKAILWLRHLPDLTPTERNEMHP